MKSATQSFVDEFTDVSGNAIAVLSQSDGVADANNSYSLDFSPICDKIATKSAVVDSAKI